MAEIKLNDGFSAEVDTFRNAGTELDSVSISGSYVGGEALSSLPTVEAYAGRLSQIYKAILNFQLLVEKDADDMVALAEKLKAADAS